MRVVDTFFIGNKERYYHSHSAKNHDLKLQMGYIGNLVSEDIGNEVQNCHIAEDRKMDVHDR